MNGDIRAELDLVASVLPSGGLLQVEVPNPESRLRVLGGWWVQWFQPQHLHFAPLPNLLAAMTERGLRPLAIKLDNALAPIVKRTGDANLYRVVARKE